MESFFFFFPFYFIFLYQHFHIVKPFQPVGCIRLGSQSSSKQPNDEKRRKRKKQPPLTLRSYLTHTARYNTQSRLSPHICRWCIKSLLLRSPIHVQQPAAHLYRRKERKNNVLVQLFMGSKAPPFCVVFLSTLNNRAWKEWSSSRQT